MKRSFALLLLPFAALPLRAETDAARLALAHEVIQLMQADRMINSLVPQIQQITSQAIAPVADKLSPAQRAKVEEAQQKAIGIALEGARSMIGQLDGVYAEIYSESELKAMKAFFETESGKAMIEKQPALMQKVMPLIQKMQADIMPKIQGAMAEIQQSIQAAPPALAAPAAPATDAPTVGLPGATK